MGIFDFRKLRDLKRSEEFAAAVEAASADILSAQERIAELDSSKERAIFDGAEGELEAIDAEIAKLEREVANLEIAKSGALSRLAEAEKRERNAAMENIAADTRAVIKQQHKAWREFCDAAEALARATETIRACDQKIISSNQIVVDGGRPDLTADSIFSRVCQLLAAKYPPNRRERLEDGTERVVVNGFSGMLDPTGRSLLIPGFWPPHKSDFADTVRRLQI